MADGPSKRDDAATPVAWTDALEPHFARARLALCPVYSLVRGWRRRVLHALARCAEAAG